MPTWAVVWTNSQRQLIGESIGTKTVIIDKSSKKFNMKNRREEKLVARRGDSTWGILFILEEIWSCFNINEKEHIGWKQSRGVESDGGGPWEAWGQASAVQGEAHLWQWVESLSLRWAWAWEAEGEHWETQGWTTGKSHTHSSGNEFIITSTSHTKYFRTHSICINGDWHYPKIT